MDVAYDHIQEEILSPEEANERAEQQGQGGGLNSEFQEAFKAVSASPWGAKLGGFFGQVKKQGESLYTDAQKEYSNASSQASRGLTDLRSSLVERTRGITIESPDDSAGATSLSDPNFALPEQEKQNSLSEQDTNTPRNASTATVEQHDRPESLPADIVKEATSMVSRFRSEAAKRLKDVQKAEDAADEALLKFGTNVRNFLREAVTVTAPEAAAAAGAQIQSLTGAGGKGTKEPEVIFETNDAEGRRVFHSSRIDAQLHAIHARADSFLRDPEGSEWDSWEKEFNVEQSTDQIAKDLDKYDELRRQMGRLVPEKVDYAAFWRRYYFLRKAVEEEEKKRREVLKGIPTEAEEEVGWGDDDEEEEDRAITPIGKAAGAATQSTNTLGATLKVGDEKDKTLLSPRRSHEEDGKSVADSDASYDIISGATSRAPGSPKEDKKEAEKKEESDEEDWE